MKLLGSNNSREPLPPLTLKRQGGRAAAGKRSGGRGLRVTGALSGGQFSKHGLLEREAREEILQLFFSPAVLYPIGQGVQARGHGSQYTQSVHASFLGHKAGWAVERNLVEQMEILAQH